MASVLNNGTRLGRIVAETIIGAPGTVTMTDLLRWARVDPTSHGQ